MKVTEIGASGRLEWDAQGAKSNGLIEMWCITYDVKAEVAVGRYTQCSPSQVRP